MLVDFRSTVPQMPPVATPPCGCPRTALHSQTGHLQGASLLVIDFLWLLVYYIY